MFRSTIALAALSLAFAAAPAALSAQTATPTDSAATAVAPRHHHRHGHALFRGITLTNDQRTQLKAIRAKYGPQFKAAREANDKDTMHQLRGQMIGEARGVLTPDQQKQFDTNRAALKARHKTTPAAAAPASAS